MNYDDAEQFELDALANDDASETEQPVSDRCAVTLAEAQEIYRTAPPHSLLWAMANSIISLHASVVLLSGDEK